MSVKVTFKQEHRVFTLWNPEDGTEHGKTQRDIQSKLSAQVVHAGVERAGKKEHGAAEMIKEAVLSKITQYLMMRDRIDNNCKGKTLIINPRTGFEQWVESRYLHRHEIMNDAKLCRTILKDLGILKDKEKKVEIVENLRMLWHRDSDVEKVKEEDVVDVESRRVE